MKFKIKHYIAPFLLTAMFAFSVIVPEDLFARGGFRGGGRSFGGSRSSSWGKSSVQRSGWGGSKARKMRSARGAGASKLSKTDRALYSKAKTNGTVFKNRADAKKSFQSKYGDNYGSKFSSKPNQRPGHIPNTTKVDGRSIPINYNQTRGGYGYTGVGGKWIMYSAIADVAMISMLMNRHSYYHGPQPGQDGEQRRSPISGSFVIFAIIAFAIMFRNRF